MRGMKTFSMILVPVMIRASMTLVSSCVTIILVPLHRPPIRLRFRRSIIGAPTFSSSLCGGNPAKCMEFRYSLGYNNSVSPASLPCGTASSELRVWNIEVVWLRSRASKHKRSFIGASSRGILNREWAVLPAGSSKAVMPEDATTKTIFASERKAHVMVFQRKVFPVPP
nr:hypothetical protein [Tanacetum cinerariifolium]